MTLKVVSDCLSLDIPLLKAEYIYLSDYSREDKDILYKYNLAS